VEFIKKTNMVLLLADHTHHATLINRIVEKKYKFSICNLGNFITTGGYDFSFRFVICSMWVNNQIVIFPPFLNYHPH
jgi:hypothetical protein